MQTWLHSADNGFFQSTARIHLGFARACCLQISIRSARLWIAEDASNILFLPPTTKEELYLWHYGLGRSSQPYEYIPEYRGVDHTEQSNQLEEYQDLWQPHQYIARYLPSSTQTSKKWLIFFVVFAYHGYPSH